ncbi:MAG: transcriptional regulator [Rhodobacterales bacterium]|nr:MAG: transcriptional regulator [Rhodobacterales bacterium]
MEKLTHIPDEAMADAADAAASVMRVLSNPARLRLLCALVGADRTVGELEEVLGAPQAYVSGQLARLRAEGLVVAEREGRQIRYRLSDPRVTPVLERLFEVFCPADAALLTES